VRTAAVVLAVSKSFSDSHRRIVTGHSVNSLHDVIFIQGHASRSSANSFQARAWVFPLVGVLGVRLSGQLAAGPCVGDSGLSTRTATHLASAPVASDIFSRLILKLIFILITLLYDIRVVSRHIYVCLFVCLSVWQQDISEVPESRWLSINFGTMADIICMPCWNGLISEPNTPQP